MKKLTLVLLVFPLFVHSQVIVNQDSLRYYFKMIINDYRISNGLKELQISPDIISHSDYWSKRMTEMEKCGHGEGDEVFSERVLNNVFLREKSYKVENCAAMVSLPNKIENVAINVPFFVSNPEIESYTRRAYRHDLNQYEIAYYAFIMWKNSHSHNIAMLEPIIRYFNISSHTNKKQTYFCFIATN